MRYEDEQQIDEMVMFGPKSARWNFSKANPPVVDGKKVWHLKEFKPRSKSLKAVISEFFWVFLMIFVINLDGKVPFNLRVLGALMIGSAYLGIEYLFEKAYRWMHFNYSYQVQEQKKWQRLYVFVSVIERALILASVIGFYLYLSIYY